MSPLQSVIDTAAELFVCESVPHRSSNCLFYEAISYTVSELCVVAVSLIRRMNSLLYTSY